jgi:type 2 lantibiotic biosynthesis protein LanM
MIGEGLKLISNTSRREISASWYRALTLTERIALWQAAGKPKLASERLDMDLARQKMSWWKELSPFEQGTAFARRLALDGLTEDELLYLLAEPIEAMQERVVGDMVWLDKLLQAFTLTDKDIPRPLPPLPVLQGLEVFAAPILPLLRHAWKRMYVEMQILLQRRKEPPFDPDTVIEQLFLLLPGQLLRKVSKVLTLELNVMRVEGRLQGETPEARFAYFVDWCCEPAAMLSILEKYPVLARQLIALMDQWRETSLELLQRLCMDWKEIRASLSPETDPGFLVEIHGGGSDAHRGGRSVSLLRFSSGFKMAYKPRSFAIDIHFQELLRWLNARSKLPPFRIQRLVDKGTYGWAEFIDAHDCTSTEQIERFYIRQGAYLALLHMLSATDMHAENLVAAGEHPVLVDLEALFRPRIRHDDDREQAGDAIDELLQASVLAVGLLPQRVWSSQQMIGVDMSGMSQMQGQVFPLPLNRWSQVGTDQMRVVRDHLILSGQQNSPRVNGRNVELCQYQHCIVFGFVSQYQMLMDNRAELLSNVLPRFARDEIRLILRPTMAYSLMLQESFHPDVLRDALDVYRYLDHLWAITRQQAYMTDVIEAERADLLSNDVPFFLTLVSSKDLYTSSATCIRSFCAQTGLETVTQRLQRLDEHDLLRQVWIIQASLVTIAGDNYPHRQAHMPALQLRAPTFRATPEYLLTTAQTIGRRLDTLAIRDARRIHWLGMSSGPNYEWQISPAGNDLYNGLSGIAFFLAYLGESEGQEQYTELAHAIAFSFYQQLERPDAQPLFGATIGAFDGWGSLLYLFAHLQALWHEPWLAAAAAYVIERIKPLIEQDKIFDIVHGSAGCLTALLSWYSVDAHPSILAEALRCGQHLIQSLDLASNDSTASAALRQKGLLTGYAHGAAGMALSLAQLAAVSQQEHFQTAALALLSFERQLFSPQRKNWPDLRIVKASMHTQSPNAARFMVAWCHGATGVGLSRIELLKYLHCDNAMLQQEIEAALQTTLNEGFGYNHSLCHGDLGNLELLLSATEQLDQSHYLEPLTRLTAVLLESGERNGWVTGLPLGVETPGLMLGLAGIGYEFLRLAQPQRIPNLLLLAPPIHVATTSLI